MPSESVLGWPPATVMLQQPGCMLPLRAGFNSLVGMHCAYVPLMIGLHQAQVAPKNVGPKFGYYKQKWGLHSWNPPGLTFVSAVTRQVGTQGKCAAVGHTCSSFMAISTYASTAEFGQPPS